MNVLAYIGIVLIVWAACGFSVFLYGIAHAVDENELYKTEEQYGKEEKNDKFAAFKENTKVSAALGFNKIDYQCLFLR